jgi:Flp pilus assembly pilin Flp
MMAKLRRLGNRFSSDEAGAVVIEYAMIGAGIAVVIALTVFATGGGVGPFYDRIVAAFRSVGF